MAERRLGHFRLLRQIAVGGMAEVYEASVEGVAGFDRPIALKVIHPNFSADPGFIAMLKDEARLAAELEHPNIVSTFDLGRIDETHYIAMELVQGSDLFRLLRRSAELNRHLPFPLAAYIAASVAEALDYAHHLRDRHGQSLGIVHRDVSPQNVLLSRSGEVKLCDFGIAKVARSDNRTATGVIKGKYHYMAPEQASGEPIDARSDLFSVGIMLYEMITGQMLYLEEDLERLLERVRRAMIPPPSTKRPDVPRELEAITMKALRRRPQDRYQSGREFKQALDAWLQKKAPDFKPQRLADFIVEMFGPPGTPPEPAQHGRDPLAVTPNTPLHHQARSLIFEQEEQTRALLPRLAVPQPTTAAPTEAAPTEAAPTSPLASAGPLPDIEPLPDIAPLSEIEEVEATIVEASAETESPSISDESPTTEFDDRSLVSESGALADASPLEPEEVVEDLTADSGALAEETATEDHRGHGVAEQATRVGLGRVIPSDSHEPLPSREGLGPTPARETTAPVATAAPQSAPGPVAGPQEWDVADGAADVSLRPRHAGRRSLRWTLAGAMLLVIAALAITIVRQQRTARLGTLEVVSYPAGAHAEIDGTPLDRPTPAQLDGVDTRVPHRITVTHNGYAAWQREVSFAPSERRLSVNAILAAEVGELQVRSEPPGAEVIVNGQPRGETPLDLVDVPLQQDVHVELRLSGYTSAEQTLSWAGGKRLELSLPLKRLNH